MIFGGAGNNGGPVTQINTTGAIDLGADATISGGIVFNGGGAADILTVTTFGGNVRINGPVTLDSALAISTAGGNVLFTRAATIDSQGGENDNLTLSAGSGAVSRMPILVASSLWAISP